MVGSCAVPWWDHVAYLLKTARNRSFELRYPDSLAVDIDRDGLTESLRAVLRLYKTPKNSDSARFIQELAEAAQSQELPKTLRRFLDWDEAREMIAGGMAIGSHTHSHTVLSQLDPGEQYEELARSRSILTEKLGVAVDALAYPVGARTSFTDQTQKAARNAGYRAAFSYYGGTNLPGKIAGYDVSRIGMGDVSWDRFRVQMAVSRATGSYWP
jgi:hypothetical protein